MDNSLEELLSQFSEQEFILVQPGGNWGDYLIYFGAECLFKKLNITFKSYKKQEFLALDKLDGEFVYIHGGGVFNEWCSDAGFACLQHAINLSSEVIINGPTSCTKNRQFLEEKFKACFTNINGKDCYMFAREQQTYELFNELNVLKNKVKVSLDKDTALHLTKEAVIERVGEEKHAYDFYAYREDNEVGDKKHELTYGQVVFDPATRCKNFNHWLKVHLHAKSIITNRTHSSVIGAVLQKPTYLFAGSYHKNRSIWENSLQELGVHWLELDEAIDKIEKGLIDNLLPTKVKKSWKFKDLYLKLNGVPLS